MKFLCLDTSGQVASCALVQDGKIIAEMNLQHGMTHSEKLLPMTEACMKLADWSWSDVTALGVVSGPGSFTGLRIGAATVKGLAFALHLPVVAVGTTQVLALAACPFPGLIVPLLDARRGEVYAAAYHWKNGKLEEVIAPCAQKLEDFLARLPEDTNGCVFTGDGVNPNREKLEAYPGAAFLPRELELQRAACVAQAVTDAYERGEILSAQDFLPEYLRDSSAVPPQGLKLWDI